MPRYVFKKNGDRKKVAQYDTTLMLTLKDVLPNDPEVAKKYIVKKNDAPDGKLRDVYGSKDNSALVRKIFTKMLKAILIEVAVGNCQFILPSHAKNKPSIYMGWLNDDVVKAKRKKGQLTDFDLLHTDYKVPYLSFSFSPKSSRQHLNVYVNKSIYQQMVDRANSGERFSKIPRELEYFLPYIYQEFSYIKERNLEMLVKYAFRRLVWHLRRGEEVRFIDKEGELRFFRPLGKGHDRVMRGVVKARLTRERNKKYGAVS